MALSLHDDHISLHLELVQLTRGLGGVRLAIADGVDWLAGLPLLREAYLSGRLSTSKVELLARHLVRGDPSDTPGEPEVITMAATSTVVELRQRLGGFGDDTRRTWVQLTRHV